jgi:hypothetical protein
VKLPVLALLLVLPLCAQSAPPSGGQPSPQSSAAPQQAAPAPEFVPLDPPAQTARGKRQPPVKLECAAAWDAEKLANQQGCVAGRVYRIVEGKTGIVRLGLCPPHSKCNFQAVVHARDRDRVGNLSYLRGRYIAVTGVISIPRGNPQIRIRQREQLHIAGSDAPSGFDADRGTPPIGQPLRGRPRNQ